MSTALPRPDAPATASRGRRRAAMVAGGAVVALGALYGAGYTLTGNTLPPNTTVGGVAVGGMTPAAAEAELRAALAPAESGPVTLRAGDVSVQKTPADLGLAIDYAASLASAGGRKTLNPAEMVASLSGAKSVPLVVTTDGSKLPAALTALAASDHGPTDAAVAFTGLTPTLTPAKDGHTLKVAEAAGAVTSAWPASSTIDLPITATPADVTTVEAQHVLDAVATPAVSAPITLKAVDRSAQVSAETLASALTFEPSGGDLVPALDAAKLASSTAKGLAPLGTTAPTDAKIKIGGDGRPTVVPSVDGNGVAPDALAAALLPVLSKTSDRVATVTLAAVHPTFDTAAAEKLGVKEITGEFTTVFPGAYPYRYVNIPKAAGLLTNVLVKPGETFSMNDALGGERTAAKGWAAGFGIMDGKETIQLGGALSQVTTTTYNAVFFAGLEDIKHKPHSLYFSRYPKGREATLSWPDVDMKFRNDSPYGVLLQLTWTGHVGVQGTLTARVWSTKQYEVKQANTKITNQKIVSGTAPVKDDSPNCVAQDAIDGFDIAFDRQFWADGKLVKSIPYTWHYNTLMPSTCTNPIAIQAARDRQS